MDGHMESDVYATVCATACSAPYHWTIGLSDKPADAKLKAKNRIRYFAAMAEQMSHNDCVGSQTRTLNEEPSSRRHGTTNYT